MISPELHRASLVFGEAGMEKLAGARVVLFGVGGVGSWCAEALVRSGLGHLALVDSDKVCVTNLNRQCEAVAGNIGQIKVDAMRDRLLAVRPSASIEALEARYSAERSASFNLGQYDAVIDAIDSLQDKVHLLASCSELGIPVFSSMGAALKRDPAQIRTGSIWITQGCPLARRVRSELRKVGCHTDIPCVYSAEKVTRIKPVPGEAIPDPERVNGSLLQITGMFGFALAGLVLNHMTQI